MKLIHISDIHLGAKPDAGKEWSEKRAQEIWETFAQVIETAKNQKVELLLISGDLFHAQPLKKELREVNYLFAKIPDTKIVLMAGNHDYLRPKSYYLTNEWGENVYFFRQEEVTHFEFPDQNASVYGMSYWHREIREARYHEVHPADPTRINILLAHGGDEKHIPFSPTTLIQNGFDYVAAGHIHKGAQLQPGKVVMAGSLEPTDCNDVGPHGYWMGELQKGYSDMHFYPIKKCEYCHESFLVNGTTAEREIYEWARTLINGRPDYQYFRLYLTGRKSPDVWYDVSRLEKLERVVDVTMQLVPDYDYDKMLSEHPDTLLGSFIRTMRHRPQDAVTVKALEFGVNALLGHKICR